MIKNLEAATRGEYVSLNDLSQAMESGSISRLSDRQLARTGEILLAVPGALERIYKHPSGPSVAMDVASFYFGAKGALSDKIRDGHVSRLMKLRGAANTYCSKHEKSSKQPLTISYPEQATMEELAGEFDFDVRDGRRLEKVFKAMTRALHSPDVLPPSELAEILGHRWYNVKQVQAAYAHKSKDINGLRADGRTKHLVTAAENIQQHLG